jgi:hypothetical protein
MAQVGTFFLEKNIKKKKINLDLNRCDLTLLTSNFYKNKICTMYNVYN